ncbi:MAG: CPBP family intramembrane metalloprotease [Deltaproteobacteria bacterium]|nr:CPBP family intramembrane metalloprotease [Deltaproteobacteria bacterium]
MSPRRTRVLLAVGFYSLLGAVGLAWIVLRPQPGLLRHPDPWFSLGSGAVSLVASLVGGLIIGYGTVLLSQRMTRRYRWARALHVEFRAALCPLDSGTILVLAAGSALAEETFFRGALQPAVGLVPAALLFGAAHLPPSRALWTWTVWALGMGLLLGVLYEVTGHLLGPVVAHFIVNYENLHFIDQHDPSRTEIGPQPPPRERTTSERSMARIDDRLVTPVRRRS